MVTATQFTGLGKLNIALRADNDIQDGDGTDELISYAHQTFFVNRFNQQVSWHRFSPENSVTSPGRFVDGQVLTTSFGWYSAAHRGDFNADGRPDIIGHEFDAATELAVFFGAADGTFGNGLAVPASSSPIPVRAIW